MSLEETRRVRQAPARPATLSRIVDEYLRRHAKGRWPVSIAASVPAIRLEAPDCDLDDRELAELVAIRAVETGCDVIFDADLLNGRPADRD